MMMGKKIRKACAFILASTFCMQPVLAYSQVPPVKAVDTTAQTVQVPSEQEESDLSKINLQAMPRFEEQSTKKALASHNATVRGGSYANKNFAEGGLPRDVLEVKTAQDPSYSRRGYMEFTLSEEEHKSIDWENVGRITLTLQVKEFFGTDKQNTVTFYNTSTDADGKWNEENLTWNNAPQIISSTETASNKILSQTITDDQVGKKVVVDLTETLKAHYQAQKAEDGVVRLGIGMGVEGASDQGGVKFYSKNHDGGAYAPYVTIYEKNYVDSLAPTVKVTGLEANQVVDTGVLKFNVVAEDNYDAKPEVEVKVNGQVEGVSVVGSEYTVQLKKGDNTVTVQAKDQAGNVSLLQTYQVIYEEKELYQAKADAFVWDRNPSGNYGQDSKLALKTTAGPNYTRECYFGFNLEALEEPYIKSAKLKIHVAEIMGNASTKAFEEVTIYETSSFDEKTISWANKNQPLQKIVKVDVDRKVPTGYFEADITEFINAKLQSGESLEDLNFNVKINKEHYNDNTGLWLSSRESNYVPVIEIERGLPAPTVEVSGIIEGEQLTADKIDIQVDAKSAVDTVVMQTEVTVNGQPVVGEGNTYTVPLVYGKNEIRVQVTDEVGNVVTKSYTLTRLEHQAPGIYYVDSENGDDNADGKSPETAWKSLDKINRIQFQPGTTISFKKGGVWTGQLKPIGSGAPGAPIVINTYGEGSRAIIDGQGISSLDTNSKFPEGAVQLENVSHYEVSGLEVINKGEENDGAYRAGILALALGAGEVEHIYIKDCYVRDVNSSCASSRSNKISGGILIIGDTRDKQGNPLEEVTKIDDVIVEDCHVKNVAIEGIRTKTWHNGKDAPERRNTNITFRNNLIEDIHGDGIVISEIAENGLVEKNIIRRHSKCPTTLNYAGCWLWDSNDTLFQYNEVYDGVYGYNDGEAFDFDIGAQNVTYQYNYSHNNRGGFLLTMTGLKEGNVFRYNVSKNDGQGTEIFFCANDKPLIHNNTIYIGEGMNVPYFIKEKEGAKFNFVNNIVQVEGTLGKFSNGLSPLSRFENNCFYPASVAELPGNPVNHPGLITQDPMLANPAGADQVMDTWTQSIWDYNVGKFKVGAGSPVIDAGVNITNNGGQDIYGNPLYTNDKADIGAHEWTPESTKPQITIEETQQVTVGETLEVKIGINNVKEMVYAQDFTVNFDPEKFDFQWAEAATNKQIITTQAAEGKVRVLVAVTEGMVSGEENIILKFTPKRVATDTTSEITVSDVTFGTVTEGTSKAIEAEGGKQQVTIKPIRVEVDKTQLYSMIDLAEKLSEEAVVGEQIGQHPQAAKTALDKAIQAAQVVANTSENQSEIDTATATLKAAIDAFKETQIKGEDEDLNQDQAIDIADLALVAYYYQADLDNNVTARKADINKDGKVDIQDLTLVANKILGK